MKPPKAAQEDPGKTEDSSELVYALSYAGTLGFCPYTALSQVSIAAIKHHDQKRLGEEWFIPSYTFTVRPKGKAGTEPEAGGRGTAYWLAFPDLLSSLSHIPDRTPCSEEAPPTLG